MAPAVAAVRAAAAAGATPAAAAATAAAAGAAATARTRAVRAVASKMPHAVAVVAAAVVVTAGAACAGGELDGDARAVESGLAVKTVDGTLGIVGVDERDETVTVEKIDLVDTADLVEHRLNIALANVPDPANIYSTFARHFF